MTQDYNDMQCRDNNTLTSHAMQGNAVCMAANRVSFFLNVHGPSVTIDTACSSGLVALSYACDDLRRGRCNWCLAGGCSALLDPRYFVGFTDWGITSPDGRCFSFDVRGNGYVRGEGAAMIAIKRLSDAKRDGDHVYCLIDHLGVNHDGVKRAITSPNEIAQYELMKRVYSESKIDPTSIDYCEAHGTGTAVGDVIETSALKNQLCGENRKRPLIIGSVKTNCGHLEGAAGSIGVIKTALALEHKQIPMNLNFVTPNPKIKFDEWKLRVPTRLEQWPKHEGPRRACVNSFGIGGTNAHVIMEGYDEKAPIVEVKGKLDNNRYSLFFNAKAQKALQQMCSNMLQVWNDNMNDTKSLDDICYTLLKRRHQLTNRLGMTGTKEDISNILKEYSTSGNSKRVFKGFAIENKDRPLAFVFCGQGAQWQNMGMDLYEVNETYRKSLDECCKYCDEVSGGWKLLDKIKSDEVNGTRVSQPATTAIQIALVDLLESWNILPTAVVGHSSGEIAAAYAAGAVNKKDAMLLAYYRGECISDYSPTNGGMAAIAMNKEDANELCSHYKNVVCACYNAPESITISGDLESLKLIGEDLQKENKFFRQLKVTNAFHSPHMAPAMPHYREKIMNIKTNPKLKAKFYSSLREQLIEDGNLLTVEYFVENLTHPVGFTKAVQTMTTDIPDIAVMEIGPHPTLKGPILQSISDDEASYRTCGTLTRGKNSIECFYESFSRLHCNGVKIDQALDLVVPNANFYYNLPLYPYDRQYLWKEGQESVRFRELDPVNTLLGRRNLTEEPSWDTYIDIKQLPYMVDHNIGGSVLAPGAMYLEMAMAAAIDAWPRKDGKQPELTLINCKFLQALVLPNDDYIRMRTTMNMKTGEIIISSFQIDSEHPDGKFSHYFKCFAKNQADTWYQEPDDLNEAASLCKVDADPKEIYEKMSNNGLHFGPQFQTMKRIRQGIKCGLVDIQIPAEEQLFEIYNLHPTLIDVAFQSMISTVIGGNAAFLPTSIDNICFQQSEVPEKGSQIQAFVKQHRCDKKLSGDVWLYANKKPFLWAKNVELTRVETSSTDKVSLLNKVISDIKYEEINVINPNDERLEDNSVKIGLLCNDINKRNSEYINELMKKLSNNITVFKQASDIPKTGYNYLLYICDDKSLPVNEPCTFNEILDYTHHIIRESIDSIPFIILTIGSTINPTNISYAGMIGFGRTIQSESPNIQTKLVDLDGNESVKSNINCLINILNRDLIDESEIVIRKGYVYSPRVVPREKIDNSSERKAESWYLDIEKPGILDTFVRRDFNFRKLKDHEILVKVEVTGLSYKDVMIAMGLLKEEAFKDGLTGTGIGVECGGTVLEVGPNCEGGFKPGDKVFAMLSDGIATHTIAYDTYVYHIPKNVTISQAAGMYVPFATAYASLVYHGHIEKDEYVLIHAGSGGVGSCAIQIASRKGCNVIATASTKEKKDYCIKLGAKYVFDSRSDSFIEDILKLTNGRGVDVVLNSLSEKLMLGSVRLLAPYGRFIEIGKIDAINDNYLNIHDFLENGSYFLFDLDRYVSRHHHLGHEWGNEMLRQISTGEFVPPQVTEFKISEISEAFRTMSAARHKGKICIRICNENDEPIDCNNIPYKPYGILKNGFNKTIAILGSRGLGLSVFEWMCKRYGNNFILISKSGKMDEKNMLVINTLRERGCDVRIVGCDISNKDELFSCLDKELKTMPPLVGVVHSAMFLQDALIVNMNNDKFHACYNPKALGAYNMHLYEQKLSNKYEFYIFFSSISSVIGNRGQCNYCAGNFYMESLMNLRRLQGLKANVMNLGAVGDVGAVARDSHIVNKDLKNSMVTSNQVLAGVEEIFDNMNKDRQFIIDQMGDGVLKQMKDNNKFKAFAVLRSQHGGSTAAGGSGDNKEASGDSSNGEKALLQAQKIENADERKKFVESSVKNAVANVLGLDVNIIRPEQALSAIGIDSIVSVELSNWIKEQYEVTLSVFDLTSGKTVSGLIENILDAVNDSVSGSSGTSGNKTQGGVDGGNGEEIDLSKFYTIEDLLNREPAKFDENLIPKKEGQSTTATGVEGGNVVAEEEFEYPELYDITQTREYADEQVFYKFLTINPYFKTQKRITSTISEIEGFKDVVNYTCYDYLGLNFDEDIHKNVKRLVDEYGTSASASRLAGGQIPLHDELEKGLADFLGVEDTIVYLGGHTCNVNAIKALCNSKDLILVDELSHNSILEGAIYSQATRMTFLHNTPSDLEKKIIKNRSKYEKILICVEGVYSMDGDIVKLPEIIRIKRKYNCLLMVDEAHSIGTVGATGHGVREYFNINPKSVDMWMGSLGKAFVSAGGYIGGTKELVSLLRWKSPGFVYSIGMPPPQCATCIYSLEKIKNEPERVTKLHENVKYFHDKCIEANIDIGYCKDNCDAPVIPVMVYDTNKCLKIIHDLLPMGVYVGPGIYPACELDRARMRFFISAAHTKEQLDKTVNALKTLFEKYSKE